MKRILLLIMVLSTVIFSFVGCTRSDKQVLFIDTPAGDTIRVEFAPQNDNYKIYIYDDILYFMTVDGMQLGTAEFVTDVHVKMLLTPNTFYDQKIQSLEYFKNGNHQYLFITSSNDDPEYGSMGWITGSNSAFLFASDLTKTSTQELLESLSFSVKSTSQTDKNYCLQAIIDKTYSPTIEEWNEWFSNSDTESTKSPTEPTQEITENKEVYDGQ